MSVNKSPECIAPSAFDVIERQQSAKVGIFNLISTMIGGGVLSLPYAISRSGLLLGFIMLTLSAITSVFSFDILVSSSRRTGAMTYQQIAFFAFGPNIQSIITFLLWCLTLTCGIAYCVLVGDLIKPIVCYLFSISPTECSSEWLRRLVIAGGILCVVPFCYMRQIKALKYTSIVSITSVIILSAIIAIKTATHFDKPHDIYYINQHGLKETYTMTTDIHLLPSSIDDVVYVFPVFSLSFLCHFNIPQVHSELTRPTRKRMRNVLVAVVIACFILYSIISFFGYFYSFKYTCGNILLNYKQNDPMVTFGRLCLGFVLLFTFPLLILPMRTSLHNLLNQICSFKNMNLKNNKNNSKPIIKHKKPVVISSNIQPVNTNNNTNNNIDWGQSLDGAAAIQDSMINENDIIDNKNINFTTRSFSNTDSPLRVPNDALGIINKPNDMLLLQEKPFIKQFKNLELSINYQPSLIWLIIETIIMIFSSLLISFLTQSVMVLWGLLGSTVGFMIAFTLPGAFYFKIRYHKGWTIRNIIALIVSILSCFAIVLCTWQAVIRLNAQSCPTQP